MITRLDGHDYYVACVSAHRPDAVQRWANHGVEKITWYVPAEEWGSYSHAPQRRIGSSETNARARNAVLKGGRALDLPVLMLDDDPIGAYEVINHRSHLIPWSELFTRLARLHREHGCMMTSANRNTNPYFVNRSLSFHNKLTLGCAIINPGSPLFDENLKTSVDLDYGLQHLKLYGAYLRVDDLIADMEMGLRGEQSAVQRHRTEAEYLRMNAYLKAKWGDALMPSKNENQLTPRPQRRTILS